MRRFDYFKGQPSEFWAKVRFISQELGYTKRRADAIRTYSVDEIVNLFLEKSSANIARCVAKQFMKHEII